MNMQLIYAETTETARAVSQGDLRLPHTENLGDLDLRRAAVLQDRIDLQSELRL